MPAKEAPTAAMLDVEGLEKAYAKDGPGVRGVGFQVAPGEFFTLLGPSGCGKTTTLRSVAGLETPDRGRICIAGQVVFDARAGVRVPTARRDIAMVFQSYAVWPHMTVAENVAFPLEARRGLSRAEIGRRVEQALAMVGLEGLGGRPASLLSGGQQQRVALARAVVREAKLLLLDEPLSNLDAQLRERMRAELRDLQQRIGTTAVYVTHDQEEAMSLSDRVALMQDGRIVEMGTPQDLYLRPETPFAARFLGLAELIPCAVAEHRRDGAALLSTPLGPILSRCLPRTGDRPGGDPDGPAALDGVRLSLLLRPEHVQVAGVGGKAGDAGTKPEAENVLRGTVRRAAFAGRHVDYLVEVGDRLLPVQAPSGALHAVGSAVVLTMPPERCVVLRGDEERLA